MTNRNQSAELDSPEEDTGSISPLNKKSLVLKPVAAGESGEGLPYAPVDWPKPGDVWGWKVGKRKNNAGYMADRYLCLPSRLQKPLQPKLRFASMNSVKEYIKKEFPDTNVNEFFASFSWKIPSKDHVWRKDQLSPIQPKVKAERSGSHSNAKTMDCKAGNRMCSVQPEAKRYSLPVMDCDICCSETGFCRKCCCILCCRTVDLAYEGYSFIRCEAKLSETHICGHIAHTDCALRSYMAGTVGGLIGLDAEYYCRRCDKKTDLVSHVTKLLETCKSLESRDDIVKALKVGLSILYGSQRDNAMRLLKHINSALAKLRSPTYFEEIWNIEDNAPVLPEGAVSHLGNNIISMENLQATDGQYPLSLAASHELNEQRRSHEPNEQRRSHELNEQRRSQEPADITPNHRIDSSKLEDEINRVLQNLRNSQELEYRVAEERFKAKKDYLLNLHEQLDRERSELAKWTPSTADSNGDAILTSVLDKENRINQELNKLMDMQVIGRGFGRTPKGILKEHFGLQVED